MDRAAAERYAREPTVAGELSGYSLSGLCRGGDGRGENLVANPVHGGMRFNDFPGVELVFPCVDNVERGAKRFSKGRSSDLGTFTRMRNCYPKDSLSSVVRWSPALSE